MDSEKAVEYLNGLLGRTLRIHATDGRMFVGLFKCTDAVSNHRMIVIVTVIEDRGCPSRTCSRGFVYGTVLMYCQF